MKNQIKSLQTSGSFQNWIMSNNNTVPEVGKGCTIMHWTDRRCYEVLNVSEDSTRCEVREMSVETLDFYAEKYRLSPDENAPTRVLVWDEKKASWGFESFSIELSGKIEKLIGWDFHENNKIRSEYGIKTVLNERSGLLEYTEIQKGLTYRKRRFDKVSVLFGVLLYRYDPSF